MKDYRKMNQAAWEEAFEHSSETFKMSPIKRLKEDPRSILSTPLKDTLNHVNLKGQTLGQFCVNSGRETMALMDYGLLESIGFDIARNMVDYANEVSQSLNLNTTFYARDILEIEDDFKDRFDIGLLTIGAMCWFDDLMPLFEVVAKTIKPGGRLMIEDSHPITNMIGTSSEEGYDPKTPKNLMYSYFRKEPWVEQGGMGYMTDKDYDSKTFVSYSHTLTEIFTALKLNGFTIDYFKEFDIDLSSMFMHLEQQGLPLSFTLIATKI